MASVQYSECPVMTFMSQSPEMNSEKEDLN